MTEEKMHELDTLRAEKALKYAHLKDLKDVAEKEGRPLNTAEVASFDKFKAEADEIDAKIKTLEEHLRRMEQLQEIENRNQNPQPANTNTQTPSRPAPDAPSISAANGNQSRTISVPASARRYGVLKAFKGQNAERDAYIAGQWAMANLFGNLAARRWCDLNGYGSVQNTMSTTDDSKGGALVPEEVQRAIIDLREQYGVFRRNARVVPMSSDTIVVPRRAGSLTAYWIGENASITQSNPTFNQVRLTAHKLAAYVPFSSELAEDAIVDIGDWLANDMAWAFAYKEDAAGFTGDGTSTHDGINGLTNILTAASSLVGAVVATTATHDTFSEIDTTDLAAVMARLPEYARTGAKWFCSAVAADLVFGRIQAAAGGNTVQTLQGSTGRQYLGYPIEVSQVLPSGVSTDYSGLPMLFFGNLMMAASLGDRRQVRMMVSPHHKMQNDQIVAMGTTRVDINVHDYGTTSEAGPIVALVGGAS